MPSASGHLILAPESSSRPPANSLQGSDQLFWNNSAKIHVIIELLRLVRLTEAPNPMHPRNDIPGPTPVQSD